MRLALSLSAFLLASTFTGTHAGTIVPLSDKLPVTMEGYITIANPKGIGEFNFYDICNLTRTGEIGIVAIGSDTVLLEFQSKFKRPAPDCPSGTMYTVPLYDFVLSLIHEINENKIRSDYQETVTKLLKREP